MTNPYDSTSAEEHRQQAPSAVRCAVVTVSDTRTEETDTSAQFIATALQEAGHQVVERLIVPDEQLPLRDAVVRLAASTAVDAILLTGGTGLAPRDCTPETLLPLLTKSLPGFGELMRSLSYQEIGPAAMLSRSFGGMVDQTLLLAMPGSSAAVRLAMEKLILPELGHLVKHSRG